MDYLTSLSSCPSLGPRRKILPQRRRRQAWDVRSAVSGIEPQVMASGSASSTETVVSELDSFNATNFSEDSLDESTGCASLVSSKRVRKVYRSSQDSIYLESAQSHSISIDQDNRCVDGDLERELLFLEQQLVVASRWQSVAGSRPNWKDGARVVKSWSSELAGNYRGNEKCKFSYENMISPSLIPISESRMLSQRSSCSECSDISAFSLPEPVESAVKFLDRVRHSSTHDKFSPKPTRKSLSLHRRSLSSSTASLPLNPTNHRRASSLNRDAGNESIGGGAGAVGVTSMWIPISSKSIPKRFCPGSPPSSRCNSSFSYLPSNSSSSFFTGNFNKLVLARKVLLQQPLLPSKAQGNNNLNLSTTRSSLRACEPR